MSTNSLYPAKVRVTVDNLMTGPGVCTPALRQAVEAYAALLSGGNRAEAVLPSEIIGYVTKIALHAYKVTDHDLQQLKDKGYSEDAIFEITLCATLGASLARLESGMLALAAE